MKKHLDSRALGLVGVAIVLSFIAYSAYFRQTHLLEKGSPPELVPPAAEKSTPSSAPTAVPTAALSVAPSLSPSFSPSVSPFIEELRGILKSRNDNDPRLDRDFKQMPVALKRAIESEDAKLPREALNQRGTLSFLLARDANSEPDLDYFRALFNEPACLSLVDCTHAALSGSSKEAMHTIDPETLLSYPQIMALRALHENKAPEIQSSIAKILHDQLDSKNARVALEAKRLVKK